MCHSNFLSFLHEGWDFMSDSISVIMCHHFCQNVSDLFVTGLFLTGSHKQKKLLSILYIKIDRSIYKFVRLSDIDIAMKNI